MAINGKGLRLTFSMQELQEYYAYIGGRIRMIEDGGAIRDERPSAYAQQVYELKLTQEKIATAIREYQTKYANTQSLLEQQR